MLSQQNWCIRETSPLPRGALWPCGLHCRIWIFSWFLFPICCRITFIQSIEHWLKLLFSLICRHCFLWPNFWKCWNKLRRNLVFVACWTLNKNSLRTKLGSLSDGFLFVCVSVCVSVYQSVCLSLSLSPFLSFSLFVSLDLSLSLSLSFYLYLCLSLSIYL